MNAKRGRADDGCWGSTLHQKRTSARTSESLSPSSLSDENSSEDRFTDLSEPLCLPYIIVSSSDSTSNAKFSTPLLLNRFALDMIETTTRIQQ